MKYAKTLKFIARLLFVTLFGLTVSSICYSETYNYATETTLKTVAANTSNANSKLNNTNSKLTDTNSKLDQIAANATLTNSLFQITNNTYLKNIDKDLNAIYLALSSTFSANSNTDQSSYYAAYNPILERAQKYKLSLLKNLYVQLQYSPNNDDAAKNPLATALLMASRAAKASSSTSFFDTTINNNIYSQESKSKAAKIFIEELIGITKNQKEPIFKQLQFETNNKLSQKERKKYLDTPSISKYLTYRDSMLAIQMVTADNLLTSYVSRLPFSTSSIKTKISPVYNSLNSPGVSSVRSILTNMNTKLPSSASYWLGEPGKSAGILQQNLFTRIHDAITQSFKVGYTLLDINRQLEGIKLQLAAMAAQTTILIQNQYGEQLYSKAENDEINVSSKKK